MMSEGNIRKEDPTNVRRITISLKEEFSFYVGQVLHKSGLEITAITIEETDSNIFGMMTHKIYAKRLQDADSDMFIWKRIEGVPVMVEYFV